MPRKPKLPPDTRLNWRDPDMPVCRRYVIDGKEVTTVTPEFEQAFRESMLRRAEAIPQLDYRNDPTYNMKRK